MPCVDAGSCMQPRTVKKAANAGPGHDVKVPIVHPVCCASTDPLAWPLLVRTRGER